MKLAIICSLLGLLCGHPANAGISDTGTSIEVENYRCTAKSSRAIECINIGRVCEAARAKEEKQTHHYLGCALDEWKKSHPGESCPDDAHWYHAGMECIPTLMQ